MKWAEEVVNVTYKMLLDEQNELDRIRGRRFIWNVLQYDEKWLQYLLMRGLRKDHRVSDVRGEFPAECGQRFVDIVVVGRDGDSAALELKMGAVRGKKAVGGSSFTNQIRKELKKLGVTECSQRLTEKCVLALPYGAQDHVKQWAEQNSEITFNSHRKRQSARQMAASAQIPLGEKDVLAVVCFVTQD